MNVSLSSESFNYRTFQGEDASFGLVIHNISITAHDKYSTRPSDELWGNIESILNFIGRTGRFG